MNVGYFLHLGYLYPLYSVILTASSTGSPVHVLMLSIQAVRGLPRLRALGIVHCIISFSTPLHRYRQQAFDSINLFYCQFATVGCSDHIMQV